jgi:UDP-N-acetylmuramyl pentapeptide phosphotransferase/UDP-N-acetylglucosamine-1-phosphate transferase
MNHLKIEIIMKYLYNFKPEDKNRILNIPFDKIVISNLNNKLPYLQLDKPIIINNKDHILVDGDSGSGKTSFLYVLKTIIIVFLGAIIAFLVFNSNPASIFMGDAGSMGLGSIIASFFIILKLELILPFVGFVIFMEALSVIIQVIYFKKTGGKRIFKMSPLHHHYQLCGMKEQKIAELAFLITIILSLIFITSFF